MEPSVEPSSITTSVINMSADKDPLSKTQPLLKRLKDETFEHKAYGNLSSKVQGERKRQVKNLERVTGGGPFAWIPQEYLAKVNVQDPLENSSNLLDLVLDIYDAMLREKEATSAPQAARPRAIKPQGLGRTASSAAPNAKAPTTYTVSPNGRHIDITTPPGSRTSNTTPAPSIPLTALTVPIPISNASITPVPKQQPAP